MKKIKVTIEIGAWDWIEDNPDEGKRCFFCGERVTILENDRLGDVAKCDHEKDCPIHGIKWD